MIKLSASAVKGFVEECYRKGFNEQQTAYLLERSLDTSDTLLYKEAGKDEGNDSDWEETTQEEFFAKHPEAKEMYETPKYRKDPRYASFIDAMDKVKGGQKIYSKKGNPYLFKWDPPAVKEKVAGYMGQYQNQMPQQQQPVQQQNNQELDFAKAYQPIDKKEAIRYNPDLQTEIYNNPKTRNDPQYSSLWDAYYGRKNFYANRMNPKDIQIR